MGHYIIIGILIGIIVIYQFNIYKISRSKITDFKNIFPDEKKEINKIELWIPNNEIASIELKDILKNINDYSSTKINNSFHITLIYIDNASEVLENITQSINIYLLKNKGAASDFYLIKDIVERNCDAAEDEVNTELPMPLYLGLMGTMIGIIVGIGSIAILGGGFKAFVNKPEESIEILMGGVAVAMISSLIGILMTTLGSWNSKNAKFITESTKNEFYTWIQTELLPVLTGNTTNSLHVLQNNLSIFNTSFASNISRLDVALTEIGTSFKDQLELMKVIERLDIKQMSIANVNVLRELQYSTKEFERFNSYMHNVNDYLLQVNRLNDNVNEHLNRTGAIEKMGAFFETETKEIEQRKANIAVMVGSVDDVLQKSFNELKENSESQISELKKLSVINQDEFKKAADEQQEVLKGKLQETSILITELKNLSSVKASMEKMEGTTNQQNFKLDNLSSSIKELTSILKTREAGQIHLPPVVKSIGYVFVGSGIAASIAIIWFVANGLFSTEKISTQMINSYKAPQTLIDSTSIVLPIDTTSIKNESITNTIN